MRAGFLSCHSLATVLLMGVLLTTTWPAFARPETGRTGNAQASPSLAAASQGTDPKAWFAKGQAALQGGDLDAAKAAFPQAPPVDPRAGTTAATLCSLPLPRQ